MSGYMYAIGPCFGCGQLFGYSVDRVPSLMVDGRREPVCLACVTRVNPQRAANGLPLIVPLPGAYEPDEA